MNKNTKKKLIAKKYFLYSLFLSKFNRNEYYNKYGSIGSTSFFLNYIDIV